MAFEIFDAYGAASRPEATLRSSGYLFISKGIMRRADCEEATHCQLMYDEAEYRLGIRLFASPRTLDSSVREVIRERSGVSMSLVPLLRYYGLPEPKKLGKRVLPVEFDDNLIVLDLGALREAKPVRAKPSKAGSSAATEEFDDDIPF